MNCMYSRFYLEQPLVVHSGPAALTHISQSELPDGPLWRLRFREHLHTDLSVHHRFICERPVVIALHLETHNIQHVHCDSLKGHLGAAEQTVVLWNIPLELNQTGNNSV